MPSNDERRQVAARLRECNPSECNPAWHLKKVIHGGYPHYLNYSNIDTLNRLADLIEPEPTCIAKVTLTEEQQDKIYERVMEQCRKEALIERTCRNLSDDDDVFVCSECRNETHGFMVDKFGCTVGFGKVVCKCPNCGCRVKED